MVVVEVRQGTLTWIAVEQEEDEEDEEEEEEDEKREEKEEDEDEEDEEEATDIKSNNPHLAGGEKMFKGHTMRQTKRKNKRKGTKTKRLATASATRRATASGDDVKAQTMESNPRKFSSNRQPQWCHIIYTHVHTERFLR